MDKIILQFIKGPKEGTKVKIRNGFMVGRDMSCEIYIDDKAISKRHAMFEISGEQAIIKDVGSSNGTFVNGKKVQKAVLSHNDEISFGLSIAKVVLEGAPLPAAVEKPAEVKPQQEKKASQKKSRKPLLVIAAAFVALLLLLVIGKAFLGDRKNTKPIEFKYKDVHDIKNRYMAEVPLGWHKAIKSNTYFRSSGAFDRLWVTFRGKVEGQVLAFVIDRLEGFRYDKELEELIDFSNKTYPRYAAVPRKIVNQREFDLGDVSAVLIESYFAHPQTQKVTRYFEVYALVKEYLVIENDKKYYGIPHQTRYILTVAAHDGIYTRIQGLLENVLSRFEFNPVSLPKGTITDVTRSQLFKMYEEKVKRAEYLLERRTIDVGNQFRALQDYKAAIWIAIEYEDLGGSSKYRRGLIKKTVKLNIDLNKKWQDFKFNIEKGYALKDRKLIADSAQKIMQLFPDPENFKHIEAKEQFNKFKKR